MNAYSLWHRASAILTRRLAPGRERATAVVGIAALVAGVAEAAGLECAAGPLVLVAVGVTLIRSAAYRTERTARLATHGQEGR
ncbi:MAG: hypothetical protein ACXWXR_03230 [Candidatus Limnocylindrales bacterium]